MKKIQLIQIILVLSLCLGLGKVSVAQESEEKLLQRTERPSESRNTTHRQQGFEFSLVPTQTSYSINQSIRLKLKSNRDVFLYLFGVNEQTGKASMILPTSLQPSNKYKAKQTHKVPSSNVEFFSRTKGPQKLIYVASTSYIDWQTRAYKDINGFLEVDIKDLDSQVNKQILLSRTQRESAPSCSLCNFKPEPSQFDLINNGTALLGEIIINVSGDASQTESSSAHAFGANQNNLSNASVTAFLSTNKSRYLLGDKVDIVYGANQAGTAYLYLAGAKGNLELIHKQKLDGKSFYQITPTASAPTGNQNLVLVYNSSSKFELNARLDGKRVILMNKQEYKLLQRPDSASRQNANAPSQGQMNAKLLALPYQVANIRIIK
jgi:hypothetical protein